jgi:hypothetical protein
VLAAVLAEADRIDGTPAKDRASFNGQQWARWLAEHRQIDGWLVRGERSGLPRQHLLDDLLPYLNPPAS